VKVGLSAVRDFIVGALVGIVSMLPGISGAVLAVCFGVYERLIADIADLRHTWKREFLFLAMVALGILGGMFGAAFVLEYLLENYRMATIFFSIGLIVGQLPMLYGKSGTFRGLSFTNTAALVIGITLMAAVLIMNLLGLLDTSGTSGEIPTEGASAFLYMIAVGLVMAISKLVPGISGATVLLVLGLMDPLTEGMTGFDMPLILSVGVGLVGGILIFSKLVNYVLVNYNRSTYLLILGLTIGSTAVIFYDGTLLLDTLSDIGTGVAMFIVGIVISLWLVRVGKRGAYTESQGTAS
jgi:putative membrane protein